MIYDVDYFIDKFEAIPEYLWTQGEFKKGKKKCANGHCGLTLNNNHSLEANALADLLEPLRRTSVIPFDWYSTKIYSVTAAINDGDFREYQQPTSKQRVLAALYDVKKMQKQIVKTIIKYVAVSETLRNEVPTILEEVN